VTRREHLASWAHRAAPFARLRGELAAIDATRNPEKLPEIALQVARSVLVNPAQAFDNVDVLIEPLIRVEAPEARLAVLDLVSALVCAGAQLRPDLEARARRGLVELACVGPPLALRMRVGLAAIVYGELDVATEIVPEVPDSFVGSLDFPNDMFALLGYMILASRVGAVAGTLEAAWDCVRAELAELCASGQLDESAVLWLARLIYSNFGTKPNARVAELAHDFLWSSHEPGNTRVHEPEFPLTDTLGGGAYRVEHHLLGQGAQTLWLGCKVASGARVLVACDSHNPDKQDVEALRQALAYRLPGIFELAYIGAFDPNPSRRGVDPTRRWASIEEVTAGSWLLKVLGPADPWTAPRKAVELGCSAGRILVRAVASGVNLTHIRPELMWAERRGGHLEVTGLSPRATELFARKVGEMVTHPVFDRSYHAPEAYRDSDDRAVAYSLAVMVAEWATGRYPFASKFAPNGLETGVHLPIAAPKPLTLLLEATIRRDRNERPRLAEFVDALEQLTF
jgi:hypothetical protein